MNMYMFSLAGILHRSHFIVLSMDLTRRVSRASLSCRFHHPACIRHLCRLLTLVVSPVALCHQYPPLFVEVRFLRAPREGPTPGYHYQSPLPETRAAAASNRRWFIAVQAVPAETFARH